MLRITTLTGRNGYGEARTDYAMLLGLLFLLIAGGGGWSVDAWRRAPPPERCN